jgi:hypothetical protein
VICYRLEYFAIAAGLLVLIALTLFWLTLQPGV